MLRSKQEERLLLIDEGQDKAFPGRPWAAVVALAFDQLVAWGVLYYSYSVLSVPIARDLGVPTSTVAAAFSGSLLVSALLAPRVGRLLDRKGARSVLLCGAVIGPVALSGLAAAQRELPLLLAFAALGVAQALSLYEPAFRAVVDWFPAAEQRSRALLVLTVIAGFASTAFLPLTAVLLDAFGWRVAVLMLATLTAVVTLAMRLSLPQPARGTLMRVAPSQPLRDSAPTTSKLLSGGFALQAFAATGATICLVWQFVERGETLAAAASIAGLTGASQVPGRLLLSPLSSAVPTDLRLPMLLIVQSVGLVALAVLSGPALIVAVVTFGAAAGVMTLERATVVVELFGRESFGSANGQLASRALFARAAAPFVVELLHGIVSYAVVLGLLAMCLLMGSAMIGGALRARRRPQRSAA